MRRLRDLLELKGADRRARFARVAGLAFDSRKTTPGDVFFALAGAKDDGLARRRGGGEGRGGDRRRTLAGSPRAPPSSGSPTRAPRSPTPPRASIRASPRRIVAVTGTSGKTSVAAFVRQIWQALGLEAASLGTIGVVSRPADGLRLADHARPDRAARASRPACRARRHPSRDGGLLAWPRPEAARRRAPRARAPSPICRATTSTTMRRSRTISPPSCGCSGISCPTARRPSSTPTAQSRRA